MLINCTPHPITIVNGNGVITLTLPVSGVKPRVQEKTLPDGDVEGVPVVRKDYGDVYSLPAPEAGTTYVVSAMVLNAARSVRNDLVAPDTGPDSAVRDKDGRIVGIRRFQR